MTTDSNAAAEANRTIVREAFRAWHDGTSAITDLFAPEMTWSVEGHSLASKKYQDRQEFIAEVLTPFASRFDPSERFRPTTVRGLFADGDTVIVLWDGRGVARDGIAYENSYAWFLQMRDGKVVDGTAFFDTLAFNDLWTRVKPQT